MTTGDREWSRPSISPSLFLRRRPTNLVGQVHGIEVALVTRKFPELVVRHAPLGNAQCPGAGEHLWIGDRRFVGQRVRIDEDEALDDMRVVAVEIADNVEA